MTLRADHVAGAFFVGVGAAGHRAERRPADGHAVAAGLRLHAEDHRRADDFLRAGAGLACAREQAFATLQWPDAKHAALVVAITALASALYEWLGFLTTNILLMFALLVVIERRKLLPAAVYSVGVVVVTYVLFVYLLKTPLQTGPFGI